MTLVVTFRLQLPVLRTSTERDSGLHLTLEDQTMTVDGSLHLVLRVTGEASNEFTSVLDTDETISRWTLIGTTDTESLYRIRLTEETSRSMDYHSWTDGRAVCLPMEWGIDGWTMSAYLPDRSVLHEFALGCERNDVQFDLLKIATISCFNDLHQFGLTDLQAETLRTAYHAGYYSVPRRSTLEEVAELLGVSHQAVSERLRRGIKTLVEHTLADQSAENPLRAGTRSSIGRLRDPSGATVEASPVVNP